MPLAEALTRRWDDDRHIVLYTADQPYRVNNEALSKVRVEMRLLAIDVDPSKEQEKHLAEWFEGERTKIDGLRSAHPGAFVHTTKRGWRAFFALPSPLPIRSKVDVDAFARSYARMAAYLFERFGVIADSAMTSWNQLARLPHVVRGGRVLDAKVLAGDPHALASFVLPDDVPGVPDLRALAEVHEGWRGIAKRWQPKQRQAFRVATSAFDHVPLPPQAERIAAAERWTREDAPRAIMGQRGRATARTVAATLHVGFALARDEVARILTGSYNRRCVPPWSEAELDDLRGMAETVARDPKHPWGFLLTRDRTGIEAARVTLAAAAASRNVAPLEEVPERFEAAIDAHRALVIRATCGAGKTHVVSRYVAQKTTGRVVVVVPRHELGRAWVQALAEAGERNVAYHASVVQRRDEDGRRHCDNKKALRVYRHGGDAARDVCPDCPRKATCPAYATRPETSARVHVVPREMIPKLEINDEDLVIFDDAAVDLVAWHRLRVPHLRRLGGADDRHLPAAQSAWLRAFVGALLTGPRGAESKAREALGVAAADVPPGDALRALAARAAEGQRSPRITREMQAADAGDFRETLRDVARVRDVLRFAAACAEGADVDWHDTSFAVHGETYATKLLRSHVGRLVVLDAAANVDELRALRADLHVERIDLDDAGETRRALLFTTNANRTALRDPKKRTALLEEWLTPVLEQLTARRARRPVFVVYKAVEADVRDHPALRTWLEADPRRELRVVHYGAIRGSNRFTRCDAVVTLGDPWLNGDDVHGRAERLGVEETSYRLALVAAELGQAHGRSRSVRRRARLTHLHVGRLVPDGWAEGVELTPIGGDSTRTRDPGDVAEFRALVATLGTNREAAALLGTRPSTLAGWKSSARQSLPRAALECARAHARAKISASSGEGGGRAARAAPAGCMDSLAWKDPPSGCVHLPPPPSPADEAVGGEAPARPAAVSSPTPLAPPPLAEEKPDPIPHREVAVGGGERDASTRAEEPGVRYRRSSLSDMGEVSNGEARSPPPPSSVLLLNAKLAERALRMLQRLAPSPPSTGPQRASVLAASFENELAMLAEAQAHARRRHGLR